MQRVGLRINYRQTKLLFCFYCPAVNSDFSCAQIVIYGLVQDGGGARENSPPILSVAKVVALGTSLKLFT